MAEEQLAARPIVRDYEGDPKGSKADRDKRPRRDGCGAGEVADAIAAAVPTQTMMSAGFCFELMVCELMG